MKGTIGKLSEVNVVCLCNSVWGTQHHQALLRDVNKCSEIEDKKETANVCVWRGVCLCVNTQVCVCVHACLRVRAHKCPHVCVRVCQHKCLHVCACVCVRWGVNLLSPVTIDIITMLFSYRPIHQSMFLFSVTNTLHFVSFYKMVLPNNDRLREQN